MKKKLYRFYMAIIVVLGLPIVFKDYFKSETGKQYKIGKIKKIFFLLRIFRNTKRVPCASSFAEHLMMITRIFQIPKGSEGVVTEFGCFKGGSTVNLSLACRMTGRRLFIFDSFEGLPEPTEQDKNHLVVDDKEIHTYAKGAFCGPLEVVKANITKRGAIEVCSFIKGYFDKTLPAFKEKVVFSFMDVDLIASLEPCVRHIWPLMQDGSYLFVHEAHHKEIAAMFFDKEWWENNLKTDFPGIVGGGSGLGLVPYNGGFKSSIGYTIKNPPLDQYSSEEQI